MSSLAIDVGTVDVIATVTTDGETRAEVQRELAPHAPRPGWLEYQPEEIWRATLEATRSALAAYDGKPVAAIEITNAPDTVLLWDQETLGAPRPAIAGSDRRAEEICTRLREGGHEARVSDLTGLALSPEYAAPKLAWVAENEPNTWALVEGGRYAVGTVESYLIARITRGTWHLTDISNASRTLLVDRATREWSDELCSLFGVSRTALPEIGPSSGRLAVTDPRSFLGLELPITRVAVHE